MFGVLELRLSDIIAPRLATELEDHDDKTKAKRDFPRPISADWQAEGQNEWQFEPTTNTRYISTRSALIEYSPATKLKQMIRRISSIPKGLS